MLDIKYSTYVGTKTQPMTTLDGIKMRGRGFVFLSHGITHFLCDSLLAS